VPAHLAAKEANRHSFKMARETIENILVAESEPTADTLQRTYLDKGDDDDEVRELLAEFEFTAYMRARDVEARGNTVLVRAHAGILNGMQVLIRNGSFLTHTIEGRSGPINLLPHMITQDIFERLSQSRGLVRAKNWSAVPTAAWTRGRCSHRSINGRRVSHEFQCLLHQVKRTMHWPRGRNC
jgi:hypothetical protein